MPRACASSQLQDRYRPRAVVDLVEWNYRDTWSLLASWLLFCGVRLRAPHHVFEAGVAAPRPSVTVRVVDAAGRRAHSSARARLVVPRRAPPCRHAFSFFKAFCM
jgi:hypothetical protein